MIAIQRGFTTPVRAGLTTTALYVLYSQLIYWTGIANAVPPANLIYYPVYLLVLYAYLRMHQHRLSGDYKRQFGEAAIVVLVPAVGYILYVAIFGYLTDYAFLEAVKQKMAAEAAAEGQSQAAIDALMQRLDEAFTLDKLFRNFAVVGLFCAALMPVFFRKTGTD